MRILVISDSHGRNDDVAGVIDQVGPIDMMIHCGDITRGDQYICTLAACPVYMVSGNNDQELDLPRERMIDLEGHRIWVVHGHLHRVHRGVDFLREAAREKGADIVMFGHTHRPYIEIDEEMTILNPGSTSYPRQENHIPTFLIMEIDEYGEVRYGHGYYKSKFSEIMI